MKIVLGISGSSAINLGVKLLKNLEGKAEIFCILTQGAKKSFAAEHKKDLEKLCKSRFKSVIFANDDDLTQALASGSFGIDKTIIAPCSISTLAKINAGFAQSLLTRAAAVALKERKTLILAVREMPFSTLSLEHMTKLSTMGVCIAPPIYASYSKAKNLEELEDFIVGKWLDLLGIKHNIFQRWKNNNAL
ncbi:UbiX family flavin prenyltransferase [Campylobacter sp. MIT 21-1685]|uniref:UbiX family flavin prenyltransferase n=1 Tax=unclassified Campylobacter TaxID=2593542 RepID=UPI00224B8B60|nr:MULTISPECIES: UbiX family flavin prenyltransferase [unclassified Campylobacter]MCX2683005.1 UbiX family flavin prenyltransferase [Campylobacter sp. MIT 21-1684]MCX2751287.1 UbiX family flavin prenyltransferase [Campylobacter sp. MIT 21-1682]MCX2807486.1 UbiX family flavin prenyltransferase [Campylobacter sp. MIT 21-1685]